MAQDTSVPSAEEMQQVYDLIIDLCQYDNERHAPGAQALRTLNRLARFAQPQSAKD